jgi:hypothetical protein
MPPEPAADAGAVIEYHFPVVIEIRDVPAADAGDSAEQVARKLVSGLTG